LNLELAFRHQKLSALTDYMPGRCTTSCNCGSQVLTSGMCHRHGRMNLSLVSSISAECCSNTHEQPVDVTTLHIWQGLRNCTSKNKQTQCYKPLIYQCRLQVLTIAVCKSTGKCNSFIKCADPPSKWCTNCLYLWPQP